MAFSIDPLARASLNLRNLQRHDPTITSIVDSTSFVSVYNHSPSSGWTRGNVEGPLFIFHRQGQTVEQYGFFVLNRNGLEYIQEPLTSEQDMELQGGYIVYESAATQSIHGIWVSEPSELASLFARMEQLRKQPASSSPAPPPQAPAAAVPARITLDDLFASAAQQQGTNGNSSHSSSGRRSPATAQQPQQQTQKAQLDGMALLDELMKSAAVVNSPQPIFTANQPAFLQKQQEPSSSSAAAQLLAAAPPPITNATSTPGGGGGGKPVDARSLLDAMRSPPIVAAPSKPAAVAGPAKPLGEQVPAPVQAQQQPQVPVQKEKEKEVVKELQEKSKPATPVFGQPLLSHDLFRTPILPAPPVAAAAAPAVAAAPRKEEKEKEKEVLVRKAEKKQKEDKPAAAVPAGAGGAAQQGADVVKHAGNGIKILQRPKPSAAASAPATAEPTAQASASKPAAPVPVPAATAPAPAATSKAIVPPPAPPAASIPPPAPAATTATATQHLERAAVLTLLDDTLSPLPLFSGKVSQQKGGGGEEDEELEILGKKEFLNAVKGMLDQPGFGVRLYARYVDRMGEEMDRRERAALAGQ